MHQTLILLLFLVSVYSAVHADSERYARELRNSTESSGGPEHGKLNLTKMRKNPTIKHSVSHFPINKTSEVKGNLKKHTPRKEKTKIHHTTPKIHHIGNLDSEKTKGRSHSNRTLTHNLHTVSSQKLTGQHEKKLGKTMIPEQMGRVTEKVNAILRSTKNNRSFKERNSGRTSMKLNAYSTKHKVKPKRKLMRKLSSGSVLTDAYERTLVDQTLTFSKRVLRIIIGFRPEVATRTIQKLKTKTEMNAEKEKEVELKQKDVVDGSTGNSTDSMETSTTSSSSTTTSTTTTTTTPSTTTTEATTTSEAVTTTTESPTTTATITVDVKTRDSKEDARRREPPSSLAIESPPYPANCPSDSLFLTGNVASAEETTSSFVKTFASFGVIIYIVSYILCCLPCGLKPDVKVKKLETDSVVGLGMRLRILIAATQTIIGFVQQLKHFHSSSQPSDFSEHILVCVFVMVTSLIIVFAGRRIGSIEAVIISFLFTAIGELILVFASTSQFGMILSICGLYSLWISLFLVVEIFLSVRSTVQLAYFLIAWIVGRAFACLFALEPVFNGLDHIFTFILTVSIGILLFYAIRMLQKSKRLKKILDNSSGPLTTGISNSAGGEYISLTAQDVLDDDDLIDEDEMDRSSMDLDFELEQLGLEPVGASSSSRA
ncbi:hypothetical protein CRE_30418 [Caenorhabditis remanei]|uniref:Uncharacterized protein n=1 Tax=Caenorhabditis remanei TaxID=31234 RepID=E3NAF5_CAERE|nr:hypothetical protein CRE_30418 [Caenorhabditis remanei]